MAFLRATLRIGYTSKWRLNCRGAGYFGIAKLIRIAKPVYISYIWTHTSGFLADSRIKNAWISIVMTIWISIQILNSLARLFRVHGISQELNKTAIIRDEGRVLTGVFDTGKEGRRPPFEIPFWTQARGHAR
jgi:hypothetical protein